MLGSDWIHYPESYMYGKGTLLRTFLDKLNDASNRNAKDTGEEPASCFSA